MLFSKKEIEEERSFIRGQFLNMYSQEGFSIHFPLDLRIDYDPSLCFANCSICHFKKGYFEGCVPLNYCVSQPALRTNTYREIQSNRPLTYTASLEMLGAFTLSQANSIVDDLNTHFILQAEFLRSVLKENEIKVVISPILNDFLTSATIQILFNMKIVVVLNSTPICWRYGIDNIEGIGSNWLIYSKTQCCEFGNVIVLYKGDNYIGVESGGAIEAIIRIMHDFTHKIFANTYCTDILFKKIISDKPYILEYYDALDVISNIACYYNDENALQLKPILERYVRTVKSYIILNELSDKDLIEDVFQIARCHYYWKECPDQLFEIIHKYLREIWRVDVFIRNRIYKRKEYWRGFNNLEIEALSKLIVNYKELL